jgi:hypothetical protein
MTPSHTKACRFKGRINQSRKISVCAFGRPELFGGRWRRSGGGRSRCGGGRGRRCRVTRGGGSRRWRRGCGLRLRGRIDPAGVHAAVKRICDLGIDLATKPRQTAERRLDVAARTPETVIEVEVTERGVEVIEPHQAHDAAAQPDAFGIARRAVEGLGGFDEFVGLALIVLGRIGRRGTAVSGFGLLILGMGLAALGKSASGADRPCKSGNKSGNGKMAQNRILKLKHPSTHRFPDVLPARGPRWLVVMPSK